MASRTDAALVAAVLCGDTRAGVALYDRHAGYVERVLVRVLGHDGELDDALQDVFVEALEGLHRLRDADAFRPWLARIAVFTARSIIRRRRRRRWLSFLPGHELDTREQELASDPQADVVRRVFALLDAMDADLRIAFCLQRFEHMALGEIALTCDVSLATVKRRIARAEAELLARARADALLAEWLESDGGSRS